VNQKGLSSSLLLIGVVVLAVIGVAVYFIYSQPKTPPPENQSGVVISPVPVSTPAAATSSSSLVKVFDGSVYRSDTNKLIFDKNEIYKYIKPARTPGDYDYQIASASASPDGKKLLALTEAGFSFYTLFTSTIEGKDVKLVAVSAYDAAWSPNGLDLAYRHAVGGDAGPTQISIYNTHTSESKIMPFDYKIPGPRYDIIGFDRFKWIDNDSLSAHYITSVGEFPMNLTKNGEGDVVLKLK